MNLPVQKGAELDAATREQIDLAIARHRGQPGPLLQILHDVQHAIGYIPPAAVPQIATALNLSRAEVHGVVTFYHHFRQQPAGRHILQICQAEACRAMHCETLNVQATADLGVKLNETTPDGSITVQAVYCLGNCACAPSVMLDGELHGRVDAPQLSALIGSCREVAR